MDGMAKQRPDGWWYPWIFVAFFAVVISVNAVMITIATGTFTGLDTKDHYRKGLAYNDALEGVRKQAAMGWVADVSATDSRLVVLFRDKEGQALTGLAVTGTMTRPTTVEEDTPLDAFSEVAPGRYEAALALSKKGQWDARLLAVKGDQTFQLVERLVIP